MDDIKKRGEIRLALESMFIGENLLSWRDGGTGNYYGMEIQLAKFIAAEIGVKLSFVPTKWDRIKEAVTSGRADFGMQQLFIPKSPSTSDLWSEPYLRVGLAFIKRKSSAAISVDQFKNQTVAILNDPMAMEYVSTLGVKDARIFDTEARMIACVLKKSCSLAISDRPLLIGHAKRLSDKITISPEDLPRSEGNYGVLLRANQVALKKAIDGAILKWKRQSETILQLEKYGLKNALAP